MGWQSKQQRTLATMNGFERYTKKTRREMFLEEMEQVVPWRELCALVAPHYPKPGNGRPAVGVERMLRIYFLQQWFNLSDPAVEEALYDSAVMRQFAGIDLGHEPVPDETTVCKFRHLLEEHKLGEKILGRVNLHLQARGVRITTGTIVDATILHAPTSTKNREQQRDPEMHQTKKGNQWFFGMKAHVGVDSKTKIIHTAVATAANVADSTMLSDLLHGEETRVWGDQAYRGQTDVIKKCAPRAQDHTHRRYRYKNRIDEQERAKNRTKSSVRSKVEHPFQVMKLKFGFVKLRYRGLKKNAHQLFVICGLVNLFLSRKKLMLATSA
jgi:IS5 family transposase